MNQPRPDAEIFLSWRRNPHFLRWHRISPFSCRSGVCAATRGRSRHLGGAVSFCRQTESHLQPPALTARGVCRYLRSHFLRSRPRSRQSAPMVLGRDGRCLDRFDTPASSVGRSDGVAVGSCLRKVNLRPSCERFQIILIPRHDANRAKDKLSHYRRAVGKMDCTLETRQPGWVHFDSNNTTNLTAKRFLTPTGETTEPSIACFPFTICTKSVYMEKVCARPDAQNPASDGRNSTCPL